ncbi:MAG: glycoside hydrolase catalytic core [Puniceicoccaceae bacterium 5H]|nr:MAG: glycoside hydrolase catalytic core [Puniceicoccaceae bacterium 5H]
MKLFKYLTLSMLLAGTLSLHAAIERTHAPREPIEQYHKAEWNVQLTADWEDPYRTPDVSLDMEIRAPSGRELVLPCFYVSGESGALSRWQARFAPMEPGGYRYRFVLHDDAAADSSTAWQSFSAAVSDEPGFLRLNNRWSFRYDNGKPFRGVGENLGWEARAHDDSKFFKGLHEDPRFNYDDMLAALHANEGTFFRTWMIYWNLPVDWKIVHNTYRYEDTEARFNPSGIERLDHLVELADRFDVHFMLTLESHVGLLGDGWERSTYNARNGGWAETPAEFFTDAETRSHYKDKLRYMIARWGYSPSIAVWELFNEVDNAMYPGHQEQTIPDAAVRDWHREMSAYLKAHDPYGHLVSTSVSHREVKGLYDVETLDFCQKHMYRATAAIPEALRQDADHFDKPCVIGEFSREWDWSKNFDDMYGEMQGDFRRGLWYGLFSPTPVLPLSWWWEYFDAHGDTAYFAHVQEINRHMLQAGLGSFVELDLQVAQPLQVLGVRCGELRYVYVFNQGDESLPLTVEGLRNGACTVDLYDCAEGTYRALGPQQVGSGRLQLSSEALAPGADVVLILHPAR